MDLFASRRLPDCPTPCLGGVSGIWPALAILHPEPIEDQDTLRAATMVLGASGGWGAPLMRPEKRLTVKALIYHIYLHFRAFGALGRLSRACMMLRERGEGDISLYARACPNCPKRPLSYYLSIYQRYKYRAEVGAFGARHGFGLHFPQIELNIAGYSTACLMEAAR
jgi:hypothetical protein